jgi:hypothetical protein
VNGHAVLHVPKGAEVAEVFRLHRR